jgi:diadenosine tetraphosphatase ApaH/serine/threonine PP2A family protein phosphatase
VRYAILSDVHGNLEALRAVLADAAEHADDLLCLGDAVGYGADPVACVDLLGARARFIVAGNHEHAVTGQLQLAWFNENARAAAEWTRDRLDRSSASYLAALPLVAEVHDATLVHASPRQPDEWEYLVDPEDGLAAFAAFTTRLCFVGHSHVPAVWSLGSSGPDYARGDTDITLEAGRRYIVNVGSVGQPRDRDPRASYAIWDLDARRVRGRRVSYDVAVARAKIAAAGLPRFLGDRLTAGI